MRDGDTVCIVDLGMVCVVACLLGMPFINDISDLKVYNESLRVGEVVWCIIRKFDARTYDALGRQLIRSTDSISANISEGFGRFHFRDKKRFYYIARGSLEESITWLTKANLRNQLTNAEFAETIESLIEIRKMLNGLIRSLHD